MCRKLTLSNWIVLLVCLALTGVVSAVPVSNPMTDDLDADEYDILNVNTIDVNTLYALDIITKGPWVDVRAYNSFSDAIDDFNDVSDPEITLLISSLESVNTNETVPSNITLRFLHGGKLDIFLGRTVTVNGQIEAGLYRIFTGAGTVSFGEDFDDHYENYGNSPTTVYPQWWGAKGDGDANDTVALQSAFNSIGDGQKIVIPPGTYHFNDTLQFDADYGILECEGILVWTNANTPNDTPAVLIGGDTGTDDGTLYNVDVSLEIVDNDCNWATGGIGVQLKKSFQGKITIERCWGFRTGLQLLGDGGGTALNQITLGDMRQNKVTVDLKCLNSGYVNGNQFYGGRFGFWNPPSQDYNNTKYVNIPHDPCHTPNDNTFYSTCFESLRDPCENRPEYFVYCGGTSNAFIRCRSEGDANVANVCFDSNSVNNLWMGGCWSIFSNITDNGTGNRIEAEGGIILNGSDAVYRGKDANDVLVVTGGEGCDNSSGNAGDGADILLTSGDGGDSSSNDGGVGGDIELTTGQGGSGSPAGSYGNIIMVKNGGYVGIGTTSPSAELDVDGDVTVDTGSVTVTGTDVAVSNGADACDVLVVTGGIGSGGGSGPGGKGSDILLTSGIGGGVYGDGGNGGDITLTTRAGGDCEMGTGGDGGDIELTTGEGGDSAEGGDGDYGNIIMVKNGGYVGIGTTSPSALLDIDSDIVRVRSSKTPSSASDAGNAGDICWDSNYIYVCVATDTWKRAALSTW